MLKLANKSALIPIICAVFLFSCGGEPASEVNDELNNNLAQMDSLAEVGGEFIPNDMGEEALHDSESVSNSGWQVNDYATYLIGQSIASSVETSDYDNGEYWYYQTLDLKGGFASVTGGVEGWKEFVIWRMEDGDDLLGEMTVECGPACGYTYNFYKGKGAEIEVYTQSEIFPLDAMNKHMNEMVPKILEKYPVDYPEDSQLIYRFPQKGTGMLVDVLIGADEIQVPILKLAWDKTRFNIDELLHDPNPEEGY